MEGAWWLVCVDDCPECQEGNARCSKRKKVSTVQGHQHLFLVGHGVLPSEDQKDTTLVLSDYEASVRDLFSFSFSPSLTVHSVDLRRAHYWSERFLRKFYASETRLLS